MWGPLSHGDLPGVLHLLSSNHRLENGICKGCVCLFTILTTQVYYFTDIQDAYRLHGVDVGELEKAATPPPPPPPPPTPAVDFSWGGARSAHPAAALASLRDIQSQEAAVTQRSGRNALHLMMLGVTYISKVQDCQHCMLFESRPYLL